MVHVMVKVKYPPHIIEDFLKFYLSGKAPTYPEYVKKIHQWAYSDYDKKVITIYEVPEDKVYKSMKAIAKRLSVYEKFEGYKYKMIPLIEASEAIEIYKK